MVIRNIVDIIISYSNRNDAMRLHQGLIKLGVKNIIVPTPNQVSSSCGLSIKTKYSLLNKVIFVIRQLGLPQNYRLYGEQKTLNRISYIKLN